MLDYKDILDKITENDVINIMNKLGSNVMGGGTTSGGTRYLKFRTICHGGDSDKLYYYTDSKSFYCYTSCGFMGFYDCIQQILGIEEHNFYAVVEYIAESIDYDMTQDLFRVVRKSDDSEEEVRNTLLALQRGNAMKKNMAEAEEKSIVEEEKEEVYYNNDIMCHFDRNTFSQEWLNEDISEDTMKKFNIAWNWYDCSIIIPHYNKTGNLVGIRRRSFYEPELNVGRKYTPLNSIEGFFPHELGNNLYGIYENVYSNPEILEQIRSRTSDYSAIVFEGEKSVLKMVSYFGNDSKIIPLASCGFNITQKQIDLLKEIGFRKIYIAFDKDFDVRKRYGEYKTDEVKKFNYHRYLEKISRIYELVSCKTAGVDIRIVMDAYGDSILGEKDSPIDKGPEVFKYLIEVADRKNIDSNELNRFKEC